jgi:Fe-S cluster biogenesis protein NfuA
MVDEIAVRALVEDVLDRDVRPYLQSHAGDVEVVAITQVPAGLEVGVRLLGACRHCELRSVTFAATVRPRLLALSGVDAVTCGSIILSKERLNEIAEFFA